MSDFSARDSLATARTTRCTSAADRHGSSSHLQLFNTLRVWGARTRQRHALRLLAERDDYLLKDIGLSQDEAFREAAKPFWQC
jgi:uncharacterized protein YjiS (DUF1127 family)